MPDHGSDLPWTDEQWGRVQRTAQDAARKARVGSSFVPLVGPLPPGQAYVPTLTMTGPGIPAPRVRGEEQGGVPLNRLLVDDSTTTPLITISCNLYLTTTQAEDPDLAVALDMVCRAATLVGRAEDAYVFNGQIGSNAAPSAGAPPAPGVLSYAGGGPLPGLLNVLGATPAVPIAAAAPPATTAGQVLVDAVVDAITDLEDAGQYGPFGCVLGSTLYQVACTHFAGVLAPPSHQITSLLGGGPLLRSSAILSAPGPPAQDFGVIVALGCCSVDLVVGSDMHVSYVQRTLEPRHVLRVSERFVLRIKQPEAVCVIHT